MHAEERPAMWTWDSLIRHVQGQAEEDGIEGICREDLALRFVARVKARELELGDWLPRLAGPDPVAVAFTLTRR